LTRAGTDADVARNDPSLRQHVPGRPYLSQRRSERRKHQNDGMLALS